MRLFALAYVVARVLAVVGVVVVGRVAVADETRALRMEAVDEVVEASDRAVQACSRNARRADTLAVLMQLTIDGEGRVVAVDPVVGDGERAAAEAGCLARVARGLRFPATGGVSRVQYPFMIVPRVVRRGAF